MLFQRITRLYQENKIDIDVALGDYNKNEWDLAQEYRFNEVGGRRTTGETGKTTAVYKFPALINNTEFISTTDKMEMSMGDGDYQISSF